MKLRKSCSNGASDTRNHRHLVLRFGRKRRYANAHHVNARPPWAAIRADHARSDGQHGGISTDRRIAFRLYITGDTLIFDDLKEIPRRYKDIDLALLHLGGTRVAGLLVTMDAKQGVELVQLVRPRQAIPIHYNDYDVFTSSLSDFQHEVEAAGLSRSDPLPESRRYATPFGCLPNGRLPDEARAAIRW